MHATEFTEPTQPETDPKRRYLCRHIFTEGHRCGSPALRGQSLCYYHGRTRREAGASGNSHCFSMPRIDDRATIQLALYEVLSRVAGGDIEYKRGSVLLYGLQIASANLPRPSQLKVEQPPQVEEVTTDYHLGDLAPIAEILEPAEAPGVGAGAPGSTASTSTLRLDPTAGAPHLASEMWVASPPTVDPAPPPYEREYTEEERHFLDTTTSVMGHYPFIECFRPESLTDEDMAAHIDALRLRAGLRPIGTEQDRTRVASPSDAAASRSPEASNAVILSAANGVPGQLAGWGGKNPRIQPEVPQLSMDTSTAASRYPEDSSSGLSPAAQEEWALASGVSNSRTPIILAAVQAVACNEQPTTDNDQPFPLRQDAAKPTWLRPWIHPCRKRRTSNRALAPEVNPLAANQSC